MKIVTLFPMGQNRERIQPSSVLSGTFPDASGRH